MSPVILTWPALLGLAVSAVVAGFGFGMLAMWRLLIEDPDGLATVPFLAVPQPQGEHPFDLG